MLKNWDLANVNKKFGTESEPLQNLFSNQSEIIFDSNSM